MPVGSPPLPEGERRNGRPDTCTRCHSTVPAGHGRLYLAELDPWDQGDEDFGWHVQCSACTWREVYRLAQDADPMPYVRLGWPAADVRRLIAAGVTPEEVARMDLTDPDTVAALRTMSALQ